MLVIFGELQVTLPRSRGRPSRFHHRLAPQEKRDALLSFEGFPDLAARLTGEVVKIRTEVREPGVPLRQLTQNGPNSYWPSPADVAEQLDELAPPGRWDSIFILWPEHDSSKGTSIPSDGWGWGMGSTKWSRTYATVANAPTSAWQREPAGEVWLHEWLHGVCRFFGELGYSMPERDADGAEIHGYVRSGEHGWTAYYRDLMNGLVQENGRTSGIPPAAWSEHRPMV